MPRGTLQSILYILLIYMRIEDLHLSLMCYLLVTKRLPGNLEKVYSDSSNGITRSDIFPKIFSTESEASTTRKRFGSPSATLKKP